MKLIPIFESTSMVECCECQTSFDYNLIPESGMGYVKCPNCDKPVTQGDASEKSIVDVDKHKGTMHKLLGIPEADKVRDHYPTGVTLAKALYGKASRQKLQSLLNYAANINSNADELFRDASNELKKLYKSK